MATKKSARAQQNQDIVRLNYVGLSLQAIAAEVGCNPTTVTARLKEMGVTPSDTRRSFMEQVFTGLEFEERIWLVEFLNNYEIPVKDFLVDLIKKAYQNPPDLFAEEPAPVPEPKETEAAGTALGAAIAEAKAAQGEIPMVTPEVVQGEFDFTVVPEAQLEEVEEEALAVEPEALAEEEPLWCGDCNQAPEITGTGTCAGCLDEKQAAASKPFSLFR